MKYFSYFDKKVRSEFKDTSVVTTNKVEFRNGLSFYYEFNDLGNNVTNSNYKEEVRKVIKELKRMRSEKIDPGYFSLLLKFREKLAGFFKEVELVEMDNKDMLVFIKANNERFIKEFSKGVITTELFHTSMSDFVIEEIKAFAKKSDQELLADKLKEESKKESEEVITNGETIEEPVLSECSEGDSN